jgi:elongation factor G
MTDAPPLIEIWIEPKFKADSYTLAAALAQLTADDRTLVVGTDPEAGAAVLKGASESHLDLAVDRLKRDWALELTIGAPQVAYRERLSRRVEIDHTHKTQTGGARQFARVKIVFEPNATGGNVFESRIVAGALPQDYMPGVETGVQSATRAGILAGFPVVDLKTTLIGCAFHEVDSSRLAFEIAARAATREALKKGGSVLLEPIMTVEVVTPEDYVGSVIGDLRWRRGQIQGQEKRGDAAVIRAMAPFSNMFGYINQLRSFTQGRASHTMRFSHYAPLPLSPNDGGPSGPAMAMRA